MKFLNFYGVKKLMNSRECGLLHIIILNKKNFSYVEIDLEKKPLYIYKNSKNLVFGSSIDYILNITKLNHEIDKKQIELYLKNGFRSLFLI